MKKLKNILLLHFVIITLFYGYRAKQINKIINNHVSSSNEMLALVVDLRNDYNDLVKAYNHMNEEDEGCIVYCSSEDINECDCEVVE